jgi:hypothetical protein
MTLRKMDTNVPNVEEIGSDLQDREHALAE